MGEAKLKIKMLIALFGSNCRGPVSQQRGQGDTRNKAARGRTLGRRRAGHISHFMPHLAYSIALWRELKPNTWQVLRDRRGSDGRVGLPPKLPSKAAFPTALLTVGDGTCRLREANLHCSNRALCSLGYKAYCDSRHVTMAAAREGRSEGGTDGGHRGLNSHSRAPIALPLSLEFSIELSLRSLLH